MNKASMLKTVAIEATAGAAALFVSDFALSRIDPLNANALTRSVGRVGMGAGAALLLDQLRAPQAVVVGVAVAPVMMALVDVAISFVPRSRQSVQAQLPSGHLGDPWMRMTLF